MRLGQLSRKLDIKPTEIREFIRNEFKIEIDLDLNTRIEDSHADAITAKFEKKVEPVVQIKKSITPVHIEEAEEKEFHSVAEVIEAEKQEHAVHSPIEVPHYHEAHHPIQKEVEKESTTIKEKEIEKIVDDPRAFIPLPVDPDAELIKVPKIKLEGLKVVGKIELPKKKEKEVEIDAVIETPAAELDSETTNVITESVEGIETTPVVEVKVEALKPQKKERQLKPVVAQNNDDEEYSIYKDKNGVYHFSQTQRENRKNSLERLKREKQESLRKAKKSQYYQQLVETEKKVESPKVKAKKQAQKEIKKQPEKVVRKGVWGKFLNWLNG
jgi:hypothetical protein